MHCLSGYDQTLSDFLINGFSFGFKFLIFVSESFVYLKTFPPSREVLFDTCKIQKEIQLEE